MNRRSLVVSVLGLAMGLSGMVVLPACSPDSTGLGRQDGGGSGGNRAASGGLGAGGMGAGGLGGGGSEPGSGGTAPGSGGNGATGGGRGGTGGATTPGSGGAATGGRAVGGRGGAATGGNASGGRMGGGAGGTSSGGRGGSGGTSGPKAECVTAADCKLVSDCCTCSAIPVGETAPACSLVCIQSKCSAQQLPPGGVACVAGRCIAGFNCDATRVTCKIAVPTCPEGEVPAVNEAGTCYQGGCVPAAQCKTVTGCGSCAGAQACVTYQTQLGNQHHCVSIPPACGGNAGCDCLGPTSCISPFASCMNYSGLRGVLCSCPNC